MKILLVHNYYSQRGGEDTYFDELKKLLKNKGHSVILYTKKSAEISTFSRRLSAIKSMFSIRTSANSELLSLIKASRPDVAHFNNVFPLIGPSAYDICHSQNLPIVQTIHNYRLIPDKEEYFGYDNYRSRVYKSIFRTSVSWALRKRVFDSINCFIFPTEFSRRIYIKNAKFRIKGSAVIPHFVNIKPGRHAKKSDFFVYAGRFSKEKGILPLLDVFSKMPDKMLVAFGDGPQMKEVYKYAKFPNIKVMGWTDRKTLFSYVRKALALISPSLSYEVMPMGVIEALALKTRVIVPGKPVFEEIVKKEDCVFFKDGDFEDMRLKIANFDKAIKVKGHYSKIYSPERHYRLLLNTYRSLLLKNNDGVRK